MYGLVLEGGGARGSYHVGAYRALIEEGVPIKGVVGTSIGALNGAMIVQGDHDKCYDLWKKITYSMVVDVNDEEIEKLMELKPNRENFSFIKEKMKKFIGDRGFDITPLKDLLEEYIDEEKIRNSGIDFGIVTVSLSELKPLYIFLEDIPEGELTHYLLASAYLPFFKSEKLGGKRYLDGGFYDNLPYRMLVEKGYKDLILVRTHAMGITKRINLPKEKTIIISPSAGIGSAMEYDSVQAQENIKMGYYDGLRQIKNLRGSEYYVLPMKKKDYYIKYLLNLKEEQIREMERILKIQGGDSKRSLFEEIIPKIASLMSLDNNYGYEDILIHLLEKKAEKCNIDRYNLYTFEELLSKVKDTNASVEKEEVSTIEKIIENIEILPIINKNEALLEIADIVFSKK